MARIPSQSRSPSFPVDAPERPPREEAPARRPPLLLAEVIFLRLPQEHAPVQVVFRHAEDGHADDSDERQQAEQVAAQEEHHHQEAFPEYGHVQGIRVDERPLVQGGGQQRPQDGNDAQHDHGRKGPAPAAANIRIILINQF